MRKLLREPLLHFLLLGALLFGVYGWLNREGCRIRGNEIVVSRGQMRSLQAQFERVWQRAPTAEELQGLIDNWVREEIFYREGMVMGLDRDDPVVRRRIAQKVEFIVDGATPRGADRGGVAELAGRALRQVSQSSRTTRCDRSTSIPRVMATSWTRSIAPRASRARARQAERRRFDDVAGRRSMRPAGEVVAHLRRRVRECVARRCRSVAGRDLCVPGSVCTWSSCARVKSGRKATLDEVRAAVERDLLHARTQEAKAAFYERVRANYSRAHRRCGRSPTRSLRVDRCVAPRQISASTALRDARSPCSSVRSCACSVPRGCVSARLPGAARGRRRSL